MAAESRDKRGIALPDWRFHHADAAGKRARVAMLLCWSVGLLLLAWTTWDQIRTATERERALGRQLAISAVEELTRRLQDTESRLDGFVNQERELLSGFTSDPSSPEIRENLWSLLQLVFPEAVAAVILDARSGREAGLGDELGERSLAHLRQFVRGSAPSLRIGGEGIQVAELSALWYSHGEAAGGLLIGLSCAELCRSLERTAAAGHILRLRPASPDGEADPIGPTEKAEPPASDETVLISLPLSDTGWVLQDRLGEDYFRDLVYRHAVPALVGGTLLLLAATVLFRWVLGDNRGLEQSRAELRQNRLKLQAILAATTDGFVMTDTRGRIELFNPAAEMMFGRLAEDVLDASILKLVPDFFSNQNAGALIDRASSGEAPTMVRESLGIRKGGKEVPVRLFVSRVRFGDEPHLLVVVQDLTESRRNEDQLAFLEQRDVLTGLLNRREFENRLSGILTDDEAMEAGPHALCYVDVDQFKLVNETCGYDAGDELLKQIAILCQAKLKGAAIVARLGSDEFGAVFRKLGTDEARKICDAFMQTVRNFLFTWRDQSFDVAVSIGLFEITSAHESASSLLKKADIACHMAKRHGRDRIHVYNEGDAELVRHHGDLRLLSAISQAVNAGRFHLYAQPIMPVAFGSGRRHFEVLVRMLDEGGTPVIPEDFIPAAERYILMPSVDRWIINRLFSLQAKNLRDWHQIEPDRFLFSVNLSGTSISDEGFLRYLKRQFSEWDVPHETICFEITETAAMRNLERARAFMEELAALGCSFALDDFGTGLSSYSYLRELPVDYLKIDGSFVRGMTEDPVSYAVVESINQIGHVLGLRTIAEWAEDKAIVNELRALKVDFAQGFAVGESLPLSDLTLDDAKIPPAPGSASP